MSFTNHNYHIVYSTKRRANLLGADLMPRLVKYTGGILRELGGQLRSANGPTDHIHLLIALPPTISIADAVRFIKSNSSRWVHDTFPALRDFRWQDGYASFTVSHSVVPKVMEYIAAQSAHHAELTFRDELLALLKRHDISFEDRYIL